jgi:hypothetical protein
MHEINEQSASKHIKLNALKPPNYPIQPICGCVKIYKKEIKVKHPKQVSKSTT